MSDAALPLVYPEQPNPPPRPTDREENVRLAAVAMILPGIMEWLDDDKAVEAEIVADLLAVMGEHDGYRVCRELEHLHWRPNEELVDIMAGLSSVLRTAEMAAVKLWAEANGIRPRLSIGDVVETPHGGGTILRIAEESACYVVETPAHVKQYGTGTTGYLIPYEKCTTAKAEAA